MGNTHNVHFDPLNVFGNRFSAAAKHAKVRSSSDYFESSIMEIHKDDFHSFIDALVDRR